MNLSEMSNGALLSMHDAIHRALAADDANSTKDDPYYGVKDTSDWSRWRDEVEAQLKQRGVEFTSVEW